MAKSRGKDKTKNDLKLEAAQRNASIQSRDMKCTKYTLTAIRTEKAGRIKGNAFTLTYSLELFFFFLEEIKYK